MSICKFCGTNIEVEREVFSMDKLFTGHSCRGIYRIKTPAEIRVERNLNELFGVPNKQETLTEKKTKKEDVE